MLQLRFTSSVESDGVGRCCKLVPEEMTCSIHYYGLTIPFASGDFVAGTGDHPHVYVGLGSHATYPKKGLWVSHLGSTALGSGERAPFRERSTSVDAAIAAIDPYSDNAAADEDPSVIPPYESWQSLLRLHPNDSAAGILAWPGRWGDFPRVTYDELLGLLKPAYESWGPTGPLYRNAGDVLMFLEPRRWERTYR